MFTVEIKEQVRTCLRLDDGSLQIVPNAKIDKTGWVLRPREKQRERLFSKISKKMKRVAPLKKK